MPGGGGGLLYDPVLITIDDPLWVGPTAILKRVAVVVVCHRVGGSTH
jgi:hypothetical protein